MDCEDDREDSRTLYCGNLPGKATEELLYELFLQAGPLEKVHIPVDKDGRRYPYGFITFKHKSSVQYTVQLFDGIQLYGCKLNIRPRRLENYVINSPQYDVHMSMPMNQMLSPNIQFNVQSVQSQICVPHSDVPSGRSNHYRNESLQGRSNTFAAKRDRHMQPNDKHRHNYKRHKR